MRQIAYVMIPVLVLAALSFCAGCGVDQNARTIVEVSTGPGRVDQSFKGTGAQLVRSGRIDEHRRIDGAGGVDIDVWIMRARPADGGDCLGTVVILHGLSESKGSFPYFGAAGVLARKGYDVVLPDLRAHGRSDGKYVTYGAKEKLDVKAVMDALIRDKSVRQPVYALGATLGAATAIQYAAIDDRCKAVLAITPYKDFPSIAERQLPLGLSQDRVQAAIDEAQKLADFHAEDASTLDAAARLTIPLLIVHGMIDLRVPAEHGEAVHAAAGGPKRLELITPGPEQVYIFTVMEDWVADKMDALIRGGLPEDPTE